MYRRRNAQISPPSTTGKRRTARNRRRARTPRKAGGAPVAVRVGWRPYGVAREFRAGDTNEAIYTIVTPPAAPAAARRTSTAGRLALAAVPAMLSILATAIANRLIVGP